MASGAAGLHVFAGVGVVNSMRRYLWAVAVCLLAGGALAQTNPMQLYADLTIDDQPAVINSKGSAHAEFRLNRETMEFSWEITFKDLTSPVTGVHTHYQKPGVRGGIVHDLAPKGITNPLKGSVIMSEGDLLYLGERHLYVDIHTQKYPDGELRGNIERRRDPTMPPPKPFVPPP